MAISVADNFSYLGSKPLDGRLQYPSIAAMTSASASGLYDGVLAYVTAEKKYYTYDSTNDTDQTLGKWREYSSGGTDPDLEDRVKTLEDDMYSANLLKMSSEIPFYTGTGVVNNGDGTYYVTFWLETTKEYTINSFVAKPNRPYKLIGTPQDADEGSYLFVDIDEDQIKDTGSGAIIVVAEETELTVKIHADGGFRSGYLLFKPMITTDTTLTYADFKPYGGVVPDAKSEIDKLNHVTTTQFGKNLLNCELKDETNNGIECKRLEDGTYDLNGTSGVYGSWFYIISSTSFTDLLNSYCDIPLIFSGVPSDSGITVEIEGLVTSTDITKCTGGDTLFTPRKMQYTRDLRIMVAKNTTLDHVIVSPMIRLASVDDDTFQKGSMTNRQLTDAVSKELTDEDLDEIVDELPTSLINGINYSTTEQVIGQWIDGKPLYQKTIIVNDVTVPANDKVNVGSTSGLNIDYGMVVDVTGVEVGGDYIEGTGYVSAWLRKPDNNFGVRCTFTETQYEKLYITFQYTKTTD